MKRKSFILLAAAAALALLAAGTARAATSVVMTRLDNPRGLAFGTNGTLYVAEAGRGGAGPCTVLRGQTVCYGPTGRISRLSNGVQSVFASGLPSYLATDGATGPHDIAPLGSSALVTIGWGENPAKRAALPGVGAQFDRLALILPDGSWSLRQDFGAYELAANPDGGPIDSNAFGILNTGGRTLVTDAGGNDLLSAWLPGGISTNAVFPSRSTAPPHPSCTFPGFPPITDSVPTAIALGPDGGLYVSELTGAPFCAGFANIYRVGGFGRTSVYCGGFTTAIDLAWGPDGNLYVLQHSNGPVFFASPGNVVRVGPGCSKTDVSGPLNRPGGLAFGPDGAMYVTVNSLSVGNGQVWRLTP